jgi:hypothetical protein
MTTNLSRRRRAAVIAAAAAMIALVAGCANVVSGSGHAAAGGGGATGSAAPSFPDTGSATPSSSPSGSDSSSPSTTSSDPTASGSPTSAPTAVVTCPTIMDTVARIRYTCLTSAMKQARLTGYSANVQVLTEPNWVMSEASLPLDADDESALEDAAVDTLNSFIDNNYPAGSDAVDTTGKTTTLGGRPAVLLTGLVNIDKSDPDDRTLKAKQDRIVSVAILGTGGRSAQLVMAVPDTQKSLWPRMDAIAAAAQLF